MLTIRYGYPSVVELIKYYDVANASSFVSIACPEGWSNMTLPEKRKFARVELDGFPFNGKQAKLEEMVGRGQIYNLIEFDRELVGISTPLKLDEIQQRRCRIYKIGVNDGYWKFGLVVMFPEARGKGYAKEALRLFMLKHPKVVWAVEAENVPSIKTAIAAGLRYSHDVFYPVGSSDHMWSAPAQGDYKSFHIYMS